jgi:hypothetical protein
MSLLFLVFFSSVTSHLLSSLFSVSPDSKLVARLTSPGVSDNALKAAVFILSAMGGVFVTQHADAPLAARRALLRALCATRATLEALEPERQKAASARLFGLFLNATLQWECVAESAEQARGAAALLSNFADAASPLAAAKEGAALGAAASGNLSGGAAVTWVDRMARMEALRLVAGQISAREEPPREVWSALNAAIARGTTPVATQSIFVLSALLQQRLDVAAAAKEVSGEEGDAAARAVAPPLSAAAMAALFESDLVEGGDCSAFAAALARACARDHPRLRVGTDGRIDAVGDHQAGWCESVLFFCCRSYFCSFFCLHLL